MLLCLAHGNRLLLLLILPWMTVGQEWFVFFFSFPSSPSVRLYHTTFRGACQQIFVSFGKIFSKSEMCARRGPGRERFTGKQKAWYNSGAAGPLRGGPFRGVLYSKEA